MKKIFYGWWVVAACFVVAFCVAGIVFYGFTAFFEPLVAEFGWSYTSVSLAASIRGMEMGILAPIVGLLVSRFGCRRLMLMGVLNMGAGMILLGFTQSLTMFYGAFALISFGAGGCTSVVTMTLAVNWFDRKVGTAIGAMASGFGASGLIVPLIVWLVGAYGWRTAAITLGCGMWLICIPMTFIIRDTPEECGCLPDGLPKPGPGAEPVLPEPSNHREVGFGCALRSTSYLFLNLVDLFRMATITAVITHIMPYLSSIGISRTSAGFVAAALPLFSVLGRFGFGRLADRVDKKFVLGICCILMALGTLTLSFLRANGTVYIFLVLFSVGFGGITVLRGAILRDYFGRVAFSRLMGILMGITALGGIVGPTMAGWVFDTTGSYVFVWQFFAGLLGIAVLLAVGIKPLTLKTPYIGKNI